VPLKTEPIPLLNPSQFSDLSVDMEEWNPYFASFHSRFHINRIEDYRTHLKFPVPPHRKTVFDFIFLTKGTTTRSKGLNTYSICKNTFFFLPPYQITTNTSMSADVTGFYCHFDPEILTVRFTEKIVNEFPFLQFLGHPIVEVSGDVSEWVTDILKRLEKEYEKNHSIRLEIASAYLFALCLELKPFAEQREKITENSAFRITQQYKNALTQFIYQKQRVSDYADHLAVSPNHLNKCIKSVTGKSAQDLLNEMVLLEVKTLLKQTDLSIGQIAFKIGKEDPSDFSKFFRTKTGFTPSEYRVRV
jgi:AraC-like DNA-binding protein